MSQAPPPLPADAAADTKLEGPTLRVLLVEPDANSAVRLTAFCHEQFGARCHVVRATDGESALALLGEHDCALILSEEKLGGLRGIDMFRQARRLQPDAVRLLVTASLEESRMVEAINSGQIFRYISKPWTAAELESSVRNALDWREQGQKMRGLLAELRRTHMELLRSLSALERTQQQMIHVERLATVGRLATGIVHEVRNQLTSLLGVFAMLRHEEGEVAALADDGHRTVRQLVQRISSIESFARSGSWTYDMEDITVGELLDRVRSLHDLELAGPTFLLAMRPEVRAHHFRMDIDKVAHAALALLREGQERIGGKVRVRASIAPDAGLELIFSLGGGEPTLADSGLTRMSSLGADPAIDVVQMIVEAHGGRVDLHGLPESRDFARVMLPRLPGS